MSRRPVLVADANLAFAEELFAPLGELRLLPGRSIGPADVVDADALLVRSVTRVDQQLLAGSRVRFVGSATIGTDHIDTDYLRSEGIACSTAPGCNATAVVDYVCSAIAALPGLLERLLDGGRVAIVGCGNVGSRLAQRLRAVGIEVRVVDPRLQPPQPWQLIGLDGISRCDLVCVHTPLTRDGPYPTRHLFDAERLSRLGEGSVLLNAGRGPVIEQEALIEYLERGDRTAILDVWEHEPRLPATLVDRVALATPHIAGYSDDGKLAGSLAVWEAYCRLHRVRMDVAPRLPPAPELLLPEGVSGVGLIRAACLAAYDIGADDRALRAVVHSGEPGGFDRLRKEYPLRREYATRSLPAGLGAAERRMLSAWGFGTAVG